VNYGAPPDDGSDVRWSSDFSHVVSLYPELAEYALGICSQAWDQGAREHAAGKPNPFWGLDTEAADARSSLMTLLDKAVSKNADGTYDFQCPGVAGSLCGDPQGPSFSSREWPTRKSALARGRQHFNEHVTASDPDLDTVLTQSLEDFRAEQGIGVTPQGKAVTLEELKA
jgi:hypothetical protein